MATVLDTTVRKTRKQHACSYCGKCLPAGTAAEAPVIAENGSVHTSYMPDACARLEEQFRGSPYLDYNGWDFAENDCPLDDVQKTDPNLRRFLTLGEITYALMFDSYYQSQMRRDPELAAYLQQWLEWSRRTAAAWSGYRDGVTYDLTQNRAEVYAV